MSDDEFANPPKTDFHGRKRELLRLGKERGSLSWDDIASYLGREFLGETELEVLLFTCEQMGIEVTGVPAGAGRTSHG